MDKFLPFDFFCLQLPKNLKERNATLTMGGTNRMEPNKALKQRAIGNQNYMTIHQEEIGKYFLAWSLYQL